MLWVEECCKEPKVVYTPIRSVRQQVQRGRYILFPNKIENIGTIKHFITMIDAIPKTHSMIAGSILIPKEAKRQLLLELALCGIRRDTLFCNSIDIVCDGIVDKFSHKVKGEN